MKVSSLKYYLLCFALLAAVFSGCKKNSTVKEPTEKEETPVTPAVTLTNRGNEEWRMGNYQEALKYFSEAYAKVKQDGNEKEMATLLNNLGLVHWSLEDNEAAMECYNEAAELAEKLGMKRLLGLTYTNRALILKQQRNFKAAFEHNDKAIALFRELDIPRDLAIAYNNQGQIYRYSKQYDPALKYYELSLQECRRINYKEGMATAYQNFSTIYNIKGEKDKAFAAARKCLALALQVNSKVRISEAYLELSHNHERFNRPDSALYYYQKYFDVESNLLEANQSDLLSRYQASLGMEVKNLRIKNLQNEKEIANNRLWFIAIGIFIFLLITAFFVYRYFSRLRFNKRQLELELYNTQQIIEVKERELKTYIIDLSKKNAIINRLQEEKIPETPQEENETEVAELLEQKILTDDDWEHFKTRFNAIYPGFFTRIKETPVPLTEAEIRILVLMRLELTGKDMANILGISPQSVRVCKMRLKKKLLKENYESVEEFLQYLIA